MSKLDKILPFIIVAALWFHDLYKYQSDRLQFAVYLVVTLLICSLFDINLITFWQAVKNITGSEAWVIVYEYRGKRTTGLVMGSFKTMLKLANDYPEAVGLYKSYGLFRHFYWLKKTGRNKHSML